MNKPATRGQRISSSPSNSGMTELLFRLPAEVGGKNRAVVDGLPEKSSVKGRITTGRGSRASLSRRARLVHDNSKTKNSTEFAEAAGTYSNLGGIARTAVTRNKIATGKTILHGVKVSTFSRRLLTTNIRSDTFFSSDVPAASRPNIEAG